MKARFKKRDGVGHAGQATASEAASTVGGGGWGRLDPDDVSRFEAEGGPAVREPVPPEPHRDQLNEPEHEAKS